jgi:hypothetical protein
MSSEPDAGRERIRELRARAGVCRYAASIPSFGGREADRVLILVAERFDREAATLESSFFGD